MLGPGTKQALRWHVINRSGRSSADGVGLLIQHVFELSGWHRRSSRPSKAEPVRNARQRLETRDPQSGCCSLRRQLLISTPPPPFELGATAFCLAGGGEGILTIRPAYSGGEAANAATGKETKLADRLAWSMVARTHPWDCVTRLRQLCVAPSAATAAADVSTDGGEGDEGDGSAALRRALARVDDMLHAQGHHSRPHYAALLAARKVRRVQGLASCRTLLASCIWSLTHAALCVAVMTRQSHGSILETLQFACVVSSGLLSSSPAELTKQALWSRFANVFHCVDPHPFQCASQVQILEGLDDAGAAALRHDCLAAVRVANADHLLSAALPPATSPDAAYQQAVSVRCAGLKV